MISYSVGRRTREIGIRMALGAQPGSVQKLILRQGLRPVLAGLAAGLLASLVAMRALASLLYGVTATDPPTFLAVACVLLVGTGFGVAISRPNVAEPLRRSRGPKQATPKAVITPCSFAAALKKSSTAPNVTSGSAVGMTARSSTR